LSNQYKDAPKSTHSGSNNVGGTDTSCGNRSPWCEEIDTGDLPSIQNNRKVNRWLGSGRELEGKLGGNRDLLKNPDSNSLEPQSSDTVQIFSDVASSSQRSGDERNGGTRSCNSSYITLSEHSVDSCSSACSSRSREMHVSGTSRSNSSHSSVKPNSDLANCFGHSNKTAKYRRFIMPARGTSKRQSPNDVQQVMRSLPDRNLSHKPESSGRNKKATESSSEVISSISSDIKSQVRVSSGGKNNVCESNLAAVNTGTEPQTKVHFDSMENILFSDVIAVSKGTESQATVPSGGEDNARDSIRETVERSSEYTDNLVTSSTLENGYEGSATGAELSPNRYNGVDEIEFDDTVLYAGCGNRYIANDEASDENGDTNRCSSELCGRYYLNKCHKTATEERPIEEETIIDQSCVCCSGGMKICYYHADGFILHDSYNRPIHKSDFCTTSDNCSGNEHCFEEHSDEIVKCMGLSENKVSGEAESIPSGLNSPATSEDCISPTDFEREADFDNTLASSSFKQHQLASANNEEVQRNVDCPPIGCHAVSRMRRPSALTRDCDFGRRTKPLVERHESRYSSGEAAPDMSLSAGEAMSAVLYARKLVSILEHALDRALSFNTDHRNTESAFRDPSTSFPADNTIRMQRPRSLSPNILRRCDGIDPAHRQTITGTCSDKNHTASDANTGTSNTTGANAKQTSDVKPPLSCSGACMRSCFYRGSSPFLSLSPEQLRKQRALLKPVTDRRVYGDAVQMLDMAVILRDAISRRREFMEPSDEFICGTNKSVSEWSLENA
jgi:hypothetical protein